MIRYLLTILTALVFTSFVYADSIDELMSGKPKFMGEKMAEENYVEVKARRLANAKIVWFNFALAKEYGIEIPAEGMTAEFEKRLLDQYAYMVPNLHDSQEKYIEKYKTFYADRYGGSGLNANYGSGRAMSSGVFQAKGGGVTPLVSSYNDFNHSHGGAALYKMALEAIWGEVTNNALPLGGNRVLMIIDTGTFTEWNNNSFEARSILVREDPLRPAHFIDCYGAGCDLKITEGERKEAQFKYIYKALPMPANFTPTDDVGKTIRAGMEEMVRRFARQYAAANAKRILHGAVSESNIEIDGTFLDFETITTLSGYGRAYSSRYSLPFDQEIKTHVSTTLSTLFESIDTYFSVRDPAIQKNLPSIKEMENLMMKEYRQYRKIEFLKLTGVPEKICEQLANEKSGHNLAQKMIALAFQTDKNKYNVDQGMPPSMGKFPLDKILITLADSDPTSVQTLMKNLPEYFLQSSYIPLVNSYFNFIQKSYSMTNQQNPIPYNYFFKYLGTRSKLINRKVPELYRPTLRSEFVNLVDRYLQNKDPRIIANRIEEKVFNSNRYFDDPGLYKSMAYAQRNIDGSTSRIIYDGVTNRFKLIHQIPLDNADPAIKDGVLRLSSNNWKTFKEIEGKVSKDNLIFTISLGTKFNNTEFVIRSSDSKKWWKNGDENFLIKGTPPGDCDYLFH